MYMNDSDLAAIERMLLDLGCEWVNKGRVSDNWKTKIYGRLTDGRQVAIYDRKVGFMIRLEKLPSELQDWNIVKCAKGTSFKHKDSHFKNENGVCVKLQDLDSVKKLLQIYFGSE